MRCIEDRDCSWCTSPIREAAVVSREIAEHAGIREIIIHTGQHFDRNMSEVFFQEMDIPRPDHFLDVNSLEHGAMTGRMLEKIEEVLLAERPDKLLVYGDTNSTLAGALAGKKLQINVVHVKAGLRSFNMNMPEEINRILTDRISDLLCCPADNAVNNLRREGFNHFNSTVVKTGDVMQDAALCYGGISASRSTIVERLGMTKRDFVLCTVHRAENTDDRARLAAKRKPLILSTGMATLAEIEEAVREARAASATEIALLKSNSSAYPAPPEDMHLRTIPHLAEAFDVVVGLSDHTLGGAVPVAAVALGGSIVEKHLTLSRSTPGSDSAFSLEPHEFGKMVEAVRTAERAVGRVAYAVSEREAASRVFRRSLFVVEDTEQGKPFTTINVRSIRPANGLHTRHLRDVLGKRALRFLALGTPLS